MTDDAPRRSYWIAARVIATALSDGLEEIKAAHREGTISKRTLRKARDDLGSKDAEAAQVFCAWADSLLPPLGRPAATGAGQYTRKVSADPNGRGFGRVAVGVLGLKPGDRFHVDADENRIVITGAKS
jgi:hypothetical protein